VVKGGGGEALELSSATLSSLKLLSCSSFKEKLTLDYSNLSLKLSNKFILIIIIKIKIKSKSVGEFSVCLHTSLKRSL
jgi:hypothetical protein